MIPNFTHIDLNRIATALSDRIGTLRRHARESTIPQQVEDFERWAEEYDNLYERILLLGKYLALEEDRDALQERFDW